MKYLKFHGFIAVPDDFTFDNEEDPIVQWVDRYLFDAEGLCKAELGLPCDPEHHVGATLMSEEAFEASFKD